MITKIYYFAPKIYFVFKIINTLHLNKSEKMKCLAHLHSLHTSISKFYFFPWTWDHRDRHGNVHEAKLDAVRLAWVRIDAAISVSRNESRCKGVPSPYRFGFETRVFHNSDRRHWTRFSFTRHTRGAGINVFSSIHRTQTAVSWDSYSCFGRRLSIRCLII